MVLRECGAAHEVVDGGAVLGEGEARGAVRHHALSTRRRGRQVRWGGGAAGECGAGVCRRRRAGGEASLAGGRRAARGRGRGGLPRRWCGWRRRRRRRGAQLRGGTLPCVPRIFGQRLVFGDMQNMQSEPLHCGVYPGTTWSPTWEAAAEVGARRSRRVYKGSEAEETLTEVTPSPTASTTQPASWPRMLGKRPSGSCPLSV